MRLLASPVAIVFLALIVGAAAALMVLMLALGQPWMGISLVRGDQGPGVLVRSVDPDGPLAMLPAGTRVLAIRAAGTPAETVALSPVDVIEEPDTLPDYATLDGMQRHQGEIVAVLAQGVTAGLVVVAQAGAGQSSEYPVRPAPRRPLRDLPLVFWVQVGVGLAGFWIGAWVAATRRDPRAEGFFLLAGLGLMVSALAAAVYSTRELALPQDLFKTLSAVNHFGALTFGVGMIGLFLSYPVRLVAAGWLWLPPVILGLWWAANAARLALTPVIGFQLPVALALCVIGAGVWLQYRATRSDLRARAALRWFGLSVLVGAGAFVLTIIAPRLIGADPVLSQGYAFLFFLLIYVGLALGVSRYRLFELEDWAFRILFTMGGVAVLIALDAMLIYAVAVDRAPAFGIALVAVAFLYLPMRDALAQRMLPRRGAPGQAVFRAVTDVALSPPGTSQLTRWEALLQAEFDPLRIVRPATASDRARVVDEGVALELPATGALPALRLEWGGGGRRLFAPQDATRAGDLCSMLDHACASRRAYETGVAEERARIAQDMHDNIGIQLMGALHSPTAGRKDALIRETLRDLRDIISNADRNDLPLDETFADLRAEIGEHLSASGIALDWASAGRTDQPVPPRMSHALRSVLREAASNILRHSGATAVQVRLRATTGELRLEVTDNGRGFDAEQTRDGANGLSNIRNRIGGLGGSVTISPAPEGAKGTMIRATIPLHPATPAASAAPAPDSALEGLA